MKKTRNLKEKGITLVVLVVTIIILLIISGISIAGLTGNGLFEKSKLAKEEHEISTAEEALKTELMSILADQQGKKDLNNLNGMNINGYNTQVSLIGRIVTMTKNSESYYFLVDSDYNVESLNNISGTMGGSNPNTGNIPSSPSTVINDFFIKTGTISGHSIEIEIDGEITTTNSSEIYGYIIIVENEINTISKTMPYNIKGLDLNTDYELKVIAIDINGNTKTCSKTISVTTSNIGVTEPVNVNLQNLKSCVADGYEGENNPENVIDGSFNNGNGLNWYGGTKLLIEYEYLSEISSMAVYTTNNWGNNFANATIYYSQDDSLTLDSDLSQFKSITIGTGTVIDLSEIIYAKRVILTKNYTGAVYEFQCFGIY